jgi:hypothetical protein
LPARGAVAASELGLFCPALQPGPRLIWALTRVVHMYRMCAALLSYTEEGQDWAPRCPPIAAGALSFFPARRAQGQRPVRTGRAWGPRTGLGASARGSSRAFVSCAGGRATPTRGLLRFGARSVAPTPARTGAHERRRGQGAQLLPTTEACPGDTPARRVCAIASRSGLHAGDRGAQMGSARVEGVGPCC